MIIPETYFTVSEELRLFGLSCLFGAALGVVWDVFRTARLVLPHNGLLVALEDIAFLLFYSVFLSAFAVSAARGEMRFYYVIGNISGFTVYLLTLGSIVSASMRKIFFALKTVFRVVTAPFRKAFVLLGKKVTVKFVGTSKVVVQKFKKSGIHLRKPSVLMYNRRENKMRKNGDKFGKEVKTKRGERSLQRSPRKARRSRSRNRLRCDNSHHKQGLL